MTTRVTIDAHAGWPVDVTRIDRRGFLSEPYRVAPNTVKDFDLWEGADLVVREVQPGERIVEGMKHSFQVALWAIKSGKRVSRSGWNGKDMFLFLVPGSRFTVNREPLLSILGEGAQVDYHAHIDMKTADGQIVPWTASQTDLLANDWIIH